VKNWQKLVLIAVSVGGGFAGAALALPMLLHPTDNSISHHVLRALFFLLFCFVAVSGLLFAINNKKTSLLFIAFALQIPYVSSPQFTCKFGGIPVYFLVGPGENEGFYMGFESYFGAEWAWGHTPDLPWRIGVNFVAIAMLIVLLYVQEANSREQGAPKQPEGQLEVNE
jgi:hypothetical protein